MPQQLTLPLQIQDNATFANFFVGANQALLTYLHEFIQGQHDFYLYLWGHAGAGCSHLLRACCQAMQAQQQIAVYIPLAKLIGCDVSVLDGLEQAALICVDDVAAIAGDAAWEEALFHLYNRVQLAQRRLLVADHAVPKKLNVKLADLASRLDNAVIAQIQTLTDAEKIAALQMRATRRGFELPHDVARFLLQRAPRNFSVLFDALEKMDRASLSAQRKLTIPFIKTILPF